MRALIDRLARTHRLELSEYEQLIAGQTPELAEYAAGLADAVRRRVYGTDVFIRGLVEVGSVCRNDCYYCGLRRSNAACQRYVLTAEQILSCCAEGYALGFRTFVLQGGEGVWPVDAMCRLVARLRQSYPDCAITLSLGECTRAEYARLRDAGADRYLLRHETADPQLYARWHPPELSHAHRMDCLRWLKELGFQVGCGFMVGAPYQQAAHLARDLKFIEEFRPHMCGIGPFLPQKDTPFGRFPAGTAEQTVYLLSLLRLMLPELLLPATTALGSVCPGGRERGLRAGANVIMPNLSPASERAKYAIYDHKLATGPESAQNLALLKQTVAEAGYRIVCARGDAIHTI